MRRAVILCGFAVLAAMGGIGQASAQIELPSGIEQIRGYDVALEVAADGTMQATETIQYNFGDVEHHGIFRDIPVRFHYDDRYDRVYPLDVESVTASPPGTPAEYSVEDISGGEKRIKIGDPDRTITGEHTYTIKYRVRGALNHFDDHDELYWNAIGSQWSVFINQPTVTVHMPSDVTKVACFAGPTGSSLPCDSASFTGSTATFGDGDLSLYEGLTIVVAIPKDSIVPTPKPILEERWSFQRAFELTSVTVGAFAALLGFSLIIIFGLAWRRGRDRVFLGNAVDAAFGSTDGDDRTKQPFERTETPVEFEPPDRIRPGEVGTLLDERANPVDVTATIIDLAVRKYLRITFIPKEGWFSKDDWELEKLKDVDDGLKAYERTLISGLFGSGQHKKVSELKYKFAPHLRAVQQSLYADAVSAGWFARSPESTRSNWQWLASGALILGIALTVCAAIWTHLAVIPVAIIVAALVLFIVGPRMPRRTAKGSAMLRRIMGFRRLIKSPTEDEKAKFSERSNLFYEYLPYAVVFGCAEEWAERFEGLQLDEPDWYTGVGPLNRLALVGALDHFTTMSAGTMAATQSSSGGSGFSGGGSSGGGGGGGGGGSW